MRGVARCVSIALLVVFAAGCAGLEPVGTPGNDFRPPAEVAADEINWPARYEPERATFFVHNQIDIAASPQTVWDVLIEAETWPAWYEGAFDVEVANSADGLLTPDASFTWKTMGFNFTSVTKEWEPPYRLAWESRRGAIQAYHAWLITPIEGGSRLVTDESQFGFLATMQSLFMPNKLRRLHDVWLAAIRDRAEAREAAQ